MQTKPMTGAGVDDVETYRQVVIDGVDYPYEVSDLGNVRRIGSGKCIKPWRTSDGRSSINLWKNNKVTTKYNYHLVACAFLDNPEHKKEVDHIDGDQTNSRLDNLRWCNRSENNRNKGKRKDNTTGFKGVSYRKSRNKYQARIRIDGVSVHLGLFATAEEASEAYKAKAKEIHGEFARFE